MEALVMTDRNLVLMALTEFLTRHPPLMVDLKIHACELYRVSPPDLKNLHMMRSRAAREMIYFVARTWMRAPFVTIANEFETSAQAVDAIVDQFNKRLVRNNGENMLRDDLDLMALRLTEDIMRKARPACVD